MAYPQGEIIQKIRCILFCLKVINNKASKALSPGESCHQKKVAYIIFNTSPLDSIDTYSI